MDINVTDKQLKKLEECLNILDMVAQSIAETLSTGIVDHYEPMDLVLEGMAGIKLVNKLPPDTITKLAAQMESHFKTEFPTENVPPDNNLKKKKGELLN